MQNADPTAGNAVVGGVWVNLDSGNFSFTAPVVSLPGRAGLNLSLALIWNSKTWTPGTGGVNVFNADKGFPGPGWRIGFGAIQGINNAGNIGPYTNSSTKALRTTNGRKITFIESSTASSDYQFLPTQLKDRNGNFISIVQAALE